MACGTPIVTYDSGGGPEAVYEGERIAGRIIGKVIRKCNSKSMDFMEVRKVFIDIRRSI